jgi:hypothetical protein
VCLQGASAVEEVLEKQRDQGIRVFVVWEPVLPTDWAAPSTATLARARDNRVQQYWDKGRLLSKAMGEKDKYSIVWDHVAVYAPGTLWSDTPPAPLYQDGPVVRVVSGLTQALQRAGMTQTQSK